MTEPDDASAAPAEAAASIPPVAAVRPKHGIVFYLLQLLPPLLLVWVMATDRGRFLDLYLGVLLMFALYSAVSLLWRLVRGKDAARLLRPAMVLLVFVGAVGWHRHENTAIRNHLLATAERMQQACDAAGRCPARPFDTQNGNTRDNVVSAPGSRVKWDVVCHADAGSFLLELTYDEQWSDVWQGGVGHPVLATTSVDWDTHLEDPRPYCSVP